MKIALFGIIGEEDNTPKAIESQLRHAKEVTVLMDSPGGEVFAGMGIFNLLKSHPHNVTVDIIGLAGSIATVIASAGDTINMSETASYMIHNALVPMAAGNADDLRETADTLEQISNTIRSVYASKTNLPPADLQGMMDEETIMSAEEALQLGFIDNIINPLQAVAHFNKIDMTKLSDLLQVANVTAKRLGLTPKAEVSEEIEEKVALEIEEEVKEALEEGLETESELEALSEMVSRSEFETYKVEIVKLIESLLEISNKQMPEEEVKALVNETTSNKITNMLNAMKSKTQLPSAVNDYAAPANNSNTLSIEGLQALKLKTQK